MCYTVQLRLLSTNLVTPANVIIYKAMNGQPYYCLYLTCKTYFEQYSTLLLYTILSIYCPIGKHIFSNTE